MNHLKITPIAWTHLDSSAVERVMEGFSTDADGGQALAEAAGRACYQSFSKPNPATATNAGYLRHILEVGHLSVLEHGTVTFSMTGVSRSLTHELIRHRHFSYSQLSQRFVPEDHAEMVEPAAIAEDPYRHRVFEEATTAAKKAYAELAHGLRRKYDIIDTCVQCNGPVTRQDAGSWWCDTCRIVLTKPGSRLQKQKWAREAARSVLPNATETRIVVTGNYRAWRHFIALRATEHADVEIRAGAIACLNHLQKLAPNVFGDFVISRGPDGSEVAASQWTWES